MAAAETRASMKSGATNVAKEPPLGVFFADSLTLYHVRQSLSQILASYA